MSSDSQGPEQQVSQRSVGSNYKPAGRYYETNNVRGTINVMTEKVVAAFDTCKLSYRKSVHIIAAVAEALDVDTDNIIMNKTSFNDWRNRIREERAEKAKQLFQNSEITSGIIHWDGNVMPDNASGTQVDRLPIVITNGQTEKILDVPALDDGKGVTQATAVYDALYKWGLNDSIKGLCCDTTYSKLGPRNGAAPLLEQLLDCDLLYLPCRHHIYEIVLKSCFEVKIPGTSGPDVPLFKRFCNAWPNIDKTKFKSGLEDKDIHQTLAGKVPEIKSFLQETLKKSFIRDDYKEMLELCDVFLGSNSVVKFRKPGAYHHARWMAKAIYTLKIYLFRDEFRLKPNEKNGLFDVCLFVVFMYAKPWITAPLAVKAPKTDLEFVKNLLEYENIDSNIASCALNKIKNHLWYLGPELSVLSLFDDDIPSHTKREIINAMNSGTEYEIANIQKKLVINSKDNLQDLKNKEIDYFVNSQSLHLFDRFDIRKEFLKQDIETWSENEDYLKALSVFVKLHVVNDCAERIVHLTQDYINVLTKDESQKQYLLRVVEDYRKHYPDSTKKTLTKRMTDA
ncbi:hypothetical protein R5R35_014608 [Gryllus longicercus]|uniref:Uncharacterized protein n=2 Tax=Gryllus longicercus TaxID=2509291 RepID=A0AAN9VNI8_9ORTH